MPSLPSRDFSLNSLAKIVIFQTNAQVIDIFSSDSLLVIFGENKGFPSNGNGI